MTEPRVAICYCFEDTYLVPTLISARSLRRSVGVADADVLLFAVGCDPHLLDLARPVATAMAAEIVELPAAALDRFRDRFEDARYYKISVLARLVLADHLPRDYDRIVYLDGDTLVEGDARFLTTAPIPDGGIMATLDADDAVSRGDNPFAPEMEERFRLLGLDEADVYVNTGVLAASMASWRAAMADAAAFYLENYGICRFFDQCAINATLGDRRHFMSPAYNFQPSFMRWRLNRYVTPVIHHYAGSLKPWQTRQWPVGGGQADLWNAEIDALGALGGDFRGRMPPDRRWRLHEAMDRLRDLRFRLRFPGETTRFRAHCLWIAAKADARRAAGGHPLPSRRQSRTPAEGRGRLAQR